LLRARWLGHRDFTLTKIKWTLAQQSDSQLQDLVKHLCHLLLDIDARVLRMTLTRLKKMHIFLHSLQWDQGLVVIVGHPNPPMRDKCMQPSRKAEIQGVLQQLLPEAILESMACEGPLPVDEGQDVQLLAGPGHVPQLLESSGRSLSMEGMYGAPSSSDFTSRSLTTEGPSLLESSPRESDQGAYGGSMSLGSSDDRALLVNAQRMFEEKFNSLSEQHQNEKDELVRSLQQQWQTERNLQAEELSSVTQQVYRLQQELQQLQNRDLAAEMRDMVSKMVRSEEQVRNSAQQGAMATNENLWLEQRQQVDELQKTQQAMMQELKELTRQHSEEARTMSEVQQSNHKLMEEQRETIRQLEGDLIKTKKDLVYKIHKMQQDMDQRSQDVQTVS
jgi:hypothetical protein